MLPHKYLPISHHWEKTLDFFLHERLTKLVDIIITCFIVIFQVFL